ncbi:hypothetical protein HGRIS_010442 [Hohenbuehelia grisea]|uniref:Myb-like domain-containing protein n=1 Tax=Hohenbuehelia grisea TaxID=104357 RepID=A0ABR3IZ39_9AGAR
MDNPQHYQPLSYALHAPLAASAQPTYASNGAYRKHSSHSTATPSNATISHHREEEEEEDDDDDEGLVEEQLNHNTGSGPASPKPKIEGPRIVQAPSGLPPPQSQPAPEVEGKRRPGRPRGSRNKKRTIPGTTVTQGVITPTYQQQPLQSAASSSTAPPQLPEVNAQNQQYYEFQWRMLNLCAEFYGAAEELVKGTPPLVVSQCYQMGPGSKVDPLVMLGEAKRICDTLLANPSRLIANPPPPMYPVVPALYQPPPAPAPTATTTTTAAPTTASPAATTTNGAAATTSPASVITNPQSFVVSLGAQNTYPHAQYATTYGTQYMPYYQYSSYAPGTTFFPAHPPTVTATPTQTSAPAAPPAASSPPQPPAPQASTSSGPSVSAPSTTPGTSVMSPLGPGVQGTWSEDEVERLKKLAEESKAKTPSGEIDWDWVVSSWGHGRTRFVNRSNLMFALLKASQTSNPHQGNEPGA